MMAINIPINKIKNLYVKKKLTTFQIAKIFGCSQGLIWQRLKKNDIQMRVPGVARVNLPADKLARWYVKDKLSTWAIEKKYGYSRSVVYKRLREANILLRSISEFHLKAPKNPFSGDSTERAYIYGFAIGDLRVRLCNKSAECQTISIACSSNKMAQIDLIRKLFSSYGHVWQGRPGRNNVISIEAFVDLSFEFLLSKDWRKQKHIHHTKENFLAFLAGFTDAEGSIFFSHGMAKIAWGNYDYKLLRYIRKRLLDMGIRTANIANDHLKGYKGKDGYSRSADYYHFCCSRKSDMSNLLAKIMPYMRHSDKLGKAHEALDNIRQRNVTFGL
jgi:intein-encoded DNA endonuclease-like protein